MSVIGTSRRLVRCSDMSAVWGRPEVIGALENGAIDPQRKWKFAYGARSFVATIVPSGGSVPRVREHVVGLIFCWLIHCALPPSTACPGGLVGGESARLCRPQLRVRPDKPIRASYRLFPKEKPAWLGRHQAGLSLVEAPGGPSFDNNTPGQIFGSKLFSESPTSPAKVNIWVSAGGFSGASSHFRYGATVMSYL